MKKSFFTLMLIIASTLVINAQSLTGKNWCTVINDEDGEPITMVMKFESNGDCEVIMAAEQQLKEDGVPYAIAFGVNIPGNYTYNDKNLDVKLNKGNATVTVDYEFKGMDAKTKALMDKQVRPELDGMKGEIKKMVLDGMPSLENMKVVSLDSKKLVVTLSVGAEVPFYAK